MVNNYKGLIMKTVKMVFILYLISVWADINHIYVFTPTCLT